MVFHSGIDFNNENWLHYEKDLPQYQETAVRFTVRLTNASTIVQSSIAVKLYLNNTLKKSETLLAHYPERTDTRMNIFLSGYKDQPAIARIKSYSFHYNTNIGRRDSDYQGYFALDPVHIEEISVYNGKNDACGTENSTFSSSGCAPMLECKTDTTGGTGEKKCFNNNVSCRSSLTRCDNSTDGCCSETTCTAVNAIMDGKFKENGIKICLPDQNTTLSGVRGRLFSYSCSNGKCLANSLCGLGNATCGQYFPNYPIFNTDFKITLQKSIGQSCVNDTQCGPNLQCLDLKCLPNINLLQARSANCASNTNCPQSSRCVLNKCEVCRETYTTCGVSAGADSSDYDCCQGSTCIQVDTYNGNKIYTCVPNKALVAPQQPAAGSLKRREIEGSTSESMQSLSRRTIGVSMAGPKSDALSKRNIQRLTYYY